MHLPLRRFVSFDPLRAILTHAHLAAPFLLGFCCVALAIHLAFPAPFQLRVAERREKLAMIASWRGVATSAAFGTSRVENGFMPEAFDAEFANAPYIVTSLNLAIFGGSQTEQRLLAREFMSSLQPPSGRPSVCLVMLELNAGVNFELVNLFHPRSFDVYDLGTVDFAASFSGDTVTVTRRIGRIAFAAISGALHYSNPGVVSSALFPDTDRGARTTPKPTTPRRGFLAVGPEETSAVEVSTASTPSPYEIVMPPGNERLLADLASEPGIRKAQFVYFVLPGLGDLTAYPDYPQEMPGPRGPVPIINLARPDRYPQLYARDLWANPGHLSAKGAAVVTRLLAEEIKDWLSRQPAIPTCAD